MKKTSFYLILLLAAVFLFTSSSYGQTKKSPPNKKLNVKKRSSAPKVTFSNRPRPVKKKKSYKIRQPSRVRLKLSKSQRVAAIKEARRLARIPRNLPPSPPVVITLTPARPRYSRSYIKTLDAATMVCGTLDNGEVHGRRDISNGYIFLSIPQSRSQGDDEIELVLETIKGKTYLLDITAVLTHPDQWPRWTVSGTGISLIEQKPIDDHILIAFKAQRRVTHVWLKTLLAEGPTHSDGTDGGWFYQAQLTPID